MGCGVALMACDCPTQILADTDTLPRPGGTIVRKAEGAGLTPAGDGLYGMVLDGGGNYSILRWPYPALNAYESIVTSTDELGFPCAVGSDLFFIAWVGDDVQLRKVPAAGGSVTVVQTWLEGLHGDIDMWGLRLHDGLLWAGFYEYNAGFTNQRTGLRSIDPSSGAFTEYEFSDGPDDGSTPHLSWGTVVVATDGGIWAQMHDQPGTGNTGLARFDGAAFSTTDPVLSPDTPAPLADGTVRAWDFSVVGGEAKVFEPDMSGTTDPCMAGSNDLLLRVRFMVAYTDDHTLVIYNASTDALVAVACDAPAPVSSGWIVGAVGFT